MWWCEDEVCDCRQPQIDRITPNMDAGFPWIRREEIWRGTFHSESTIEERARQQEELRTAALDRGIVLDADLHGVRYETRVDSPTPAERDEQMAREWLGHVPQHEPACQRQFAGEACDCPEQDMAGSLVALIARVREEFAETVADILAQYPQTYGNAPEVVRTLARAQ